MLCRVGSGCQRALGRRGRRALTAGIYILGTVLAVIGVARDAVHPVRTIAEDPVLWSADHESGDTRNWWAPEPAHKEGHNCGGEYNSGGGVSDVVRLIAHTGRYSAVLHLPNARNQQGVRLFRWCEPVDNRALYYSAWYFFPQQYEVRDWWAIMQWKSPGSINGKFGLNVRNRPSGTMFVGLGRGQDSGGGFWSQSIVDLPVGQWVHLEVYYEKAVDTSGRVTVWQDGVRIINLPDVRTANSDQLSWSVINYGQGIVPSEVTIYVDDAAISLNPTWGADIKSRKSPAKDGSPAA